MTNVTIKKVIHPNATSMHLNNKRVNIITTQKKDYQLSFKVLSDNLEPRAIHLVKKNVVTTVLSLSEEAAVALAVGLVEELKKNGIIFLILCNFFKFDTFNIV